MSSEKRPIRGVELAQHVHNARYVCPSAKNPLREFSFISGYEECSHRYDLERVNYPFLTLEMIVSGQATLFLNNQKLRVGPGFCFCAGPETTFRLQAHSHKPFTKYFVAFGKSSHSTIPSRDKLYPGFVYEFAAPEELSKWNEMILEEGASQLGNASEISAELISILIKKIVPELNSKSKERTTDALVQRALSVIEKDFQTVSSLQDLAERLKISSEHLCRAFKANDKSSPYQILTRRKMEHAYAQLKMSATPIQEIAHSLGFTDAFHFSRAFKKHYGYAPSKARNN